MRQFARTCRCTLLLLAAAAPALAAATMRLEVGSTTGTPGATVDVPLSITDAKNLGSLQFDLVYDPKLFEPSQPPVKAGALLPGAMVESNAVEPGTLRVAMISGEPVNGSGEILVLTCLVAQDASGAAEIRPTAVRAWDHRNNLDMLVESSTGLLTIAPRLPWTPLVAIAAGVVVLLVVLVAIARRGRAAKGA